MSSPKNVTIRPSRIGMLGCSSGCAVFLGAIIVFAFQSMLALRAIFTLYSIWAYGIGILFPVAFILWYFFEGIPGAWNQRVVFEEEVLRFKDDENEEEIQYKQVVGFEVEQNLFRGFDGGPNTPTCRIVFHCRAAQPTTVTCRCHAFPVHSILKILAELAKRLDLAQVRISKLHDFDNERELRRAAKGLGQISLDVEENCFWFTPRIF